MLRAQPCCQERARVEAAAPLKYSLAALVKSSLASDGSPLMPPLMPLLPVLALPMPLLPLAPRPLLTPQHCGASPAAAAVQHLAGWAGGRGKVGPGALGTLGPLRRRRRTKPCSRLCSPQAVSTIASAPPTPPPCRCPPPCSWSCPACSLLLPRLPRTSRRPRHQRRGRGGQQRRRRRRQVTASMEPLLSPGTVRPLPWPRSPRRRCFQSFYGSQTSAPRG